MLVGSQPDFFSLDAFKDTELLVTLHSNWFTGECHPGLLLFGPAADLPQMPRMLCLRTFQRADGHTLLVASDQAQHSGTHALWWGKSTPSTMSTSNGFCTP